MLYPARGCSATQTPDQILKDVASSHDNEVKPVSSLILLVSM